MRALASAAVLITAVLCLAGGNAVAQDRGGPVFGAADSDLDGTFDLQGGAQIRDLPSQFVQGTCPLTKTWSTPSKIDHQSDAATGDPDKDGRQSIFFSYYNWSDKSYLLGFENSGDDAFDVAWSSGPQRSGSFASIAIDDIDSDGSQEIVAAQLDHTVRTFENNGDNTYTEQIPTPTMGGDLPIRGMEIADTDGDVMKNIMVVQSRSRSPIFGTFSIHAHDGSQVYAWISNQYLWRVSSGYFDDDEFLDILVTHGGFPQYLQFSLDWIEFDGTGYARRTITMPGNGLALATEVADTDGDDSNELLVAGLYNGQPQLMVFDSPADNTAQVRQQIPFSATANPMDVTVGNVWNGAFPDIAVSTHSSGGLAQVFFFRFDGSKHAETCHTGSEIAESQSAMTSVELALSDGDGKADVVISGPKSTFILEASEEIVSLTPDIKLNGADGNMQIRQGEQLEVTASLETTLETDAGMEMWMVAARKKAGVREFFSRGLAGGWRQGVQGSYIGGTKAVGPMLMFSSASLHPGTYTFWFGSDLRPNGELDTDTLRLERVQVEVQP